MASKKHKLVNFNYLTNAEAELFLGLKTKRAKKVEQEIVRNALGLVLSAENEVEVDGEVVSVSNAELLAYRTVKDALDSLKELVNTKVDQNTVNTTVAGALQGLALTGSEDTDSLTISLDLGQGKDAVQLGKVDIPVVTVTEVEQIIASLDSEVK